MTRLRQVRLKLTKRGIEISCIAKKMPHLRPQVLNRLNRKQCRAVQRSDPIRTASIEISVLFERDKFELR